MKRKVKGHIWTKDDDAFLMANYNNMSVSKIAETIGCSCYSVTKRRKNMGLASKKLNKKDSRLDRCVDKNETKKFYFVVKNHMECNGIDSEIPKVLYQNNKENIIVVTLDNGVLRIDKKYLKSLANELADICEVFTEEG